MQDICDFLKQVPLFAALSPAELSFLKERALSQRYEPGQIIFSESEPCEGLFVIQTGEIKIFQGVRERSRTSAGHRGRRKLAG